MSRSWERDVSVLQPRLGTRLGVLLTPQLALGAVFLRVQELLNTVCPNVLRLLMETYPAFEISGVKTLVPIGCRQAVDQKVSDIRRNRYIESRTGCSEMSRMDFEAPDS